MATRNEIIYSIRNLAYGGITSSEATISTAQIAFWIDVERAKLMKEEFEKNKALSPIWIQDLGCVEVTCADKVECCDFGCGSDEYIYKTVLPIPRPVNINWSGIHNNTLITYVGLATHDMPFEFTAEPIASRFGAEEADATTFADITADLCGIGRGFLLSYVEARRSAGRRD